MNDAVEDSVSDGLLADDIVPLVDRDLWCNDCGWFTMTIFDDLHEGRSDIDLEIYPNPTSQYIFIQFASPEDAMISLYTSIGEVVIASRKFSNSIQIDLSQSPSGAYLFVITNKKQTYLSSIVKE